MDIGTIILRGSGEGDVAPLERLAIGFHDHDAPSDVGAGGQHCPLHQALVAEGDIIADVCSEEDTVITQGEVFPV
jgi:hypothetical protein